MNSLRKYIVSLDKIKTKLFGFIFASTLILGCNNKNDLKPISSENSLPPVIVLQPFNGIPKENIIFVYNELRNIYPRIKINGSIALPVSAFFKPRNRYRADSLLKFLGAITPEGHITIGLTNKDISYTKGRVQDYGIMGLGCSPGNSCVVSTFRLSKNNVLIQYFKLSIHELGHTRGLAHCRVKTCYMRDAEGKNHTDEETDFCDNCKSHLISKGWTFKN